MIYRRFKHEALLYALAFLIALSLRLIQLGAMPLTDLEAAPALQALRISQSAETALDPHPFYILSASILFMVYGGGTNTLARMIPALVGSLFVFAPLLFDDRLKPRPSLILAFFIALDPGLIAISRQAASPIFAIVFLTFAIGFFNKNKPALASFFAALALLSGPSIWLGLLGVGITWAIYQFFNRRLQTESQPQKVELASSNLIIFFLTFIAVGTLFLLVPTGIGSAFASIPAFFGSWFERSQFTGGMVLLSLLVYQALALILFIAASIRGWTHGVRRIIFLCIWFLVSLLLVIFLPSRQIADLAWALLPLNALAALEIARYFNIFPEERREVSGVIALTAFIWVFAWLGLAGMTWFSPDSREYLIRFWMAIGALVLLILSLLLVAAGWSTRIARIGGVWGLTLVLGVLGFGGALGAAGLRGSNAPELWWLPASPLQADLLEETVSQVSEFGLGNDTSGSVVIVGLRSPALEWALREHPVQVVDGLDINNSPEFVITPYEMDPVLVSAYRGQDFVWYQSPLWDTAPTNTWLRWVTLREMPQTGETIILWARDDLFLD